MTEKQCAACKRLLPLELFADDRRLRCGKTSRCRDCEKQRNHKWFKDNRSKVYAAKLEWEAKHPITTWASDAIGSHKISGYLVEFNAKQLTEFAIKNQTCWLCGGEVIFRGGKGNPLNATIDRIFNEKILTLENIKLAHFACNAGKSNQSLEEFIERCRGVISLHCSQRFNR